MEHRSNLKEKPHQFGNDWLWGLILFVAVILTYSPVWWAGFIWDDDGILTANPDIVGPLGLKEIWTTSAAQQFPLVLTTFWIEHALWGLAPLPYHLVNVCLHGACAIVFWRVLRSLRVSGAWLGAALWALHPVQVESVAWISEMKNTQSCLFYLLSILFFIRLLRARGFEGRTGSGGAYALTLLCAALAMSSKSSTVILPIVLCLCAWWIEGRWQWRNPIRLAPVFLMAFIAGVLSIWTVRQDATLHYPQMVRSWPERMIAAGDAVWFYMGKLLWPHPLITIYPRWEIDAGQWSSYLSLLAATGVVVILWIKSKSWSRPCFFALAYFLVALLPVLGLVDHSILRYSLVFDHFQYLASMAPLALAGAGMVWVANVVIPGRRWLLSVLSGGVLLILAILSWRQTWIYKNPETLWTYTLAWNPTCLVASDMLSVLSAQNGHIDEAIAQLQRVVEMDPNYAEAHYNLGIDFSRKGQIDDAVAQFQQALDLNPNYAEAHYNLGVIHDEKGRVDDAIAEFQAALESKPSYAEANNNLGIALGEKGHFEAAIAQFEKALEANPKYAEAHNNLGNIFFQDRRLNEAINQYQKALEVDPTYAEAHNNLGLALFQKRRVDEAVTEFQEAVRLKPDFTAAQNNLTKAQAIAKEIENRKR